MRSTLLAILIPAVATAAVPLRWTVETSKATPAAFEAYQGETLDLEAALMSHGKPLQAPLNYALYWQTNGMGSVYWSTNCAAGIGATNVMRATWRPEYDAGAKAYNCFIGAPGDIYHAAFQLRLRPSPGATPGALPLPTPTIDFARVTVLNPPWPTNAVSVADAERIAAAAVAPVAAEVATIPRITESDEHEGWARYADYASDSYYATEARKADEVGGYDGQDLQRMEEDVAENRNAIDDLENAKRDMTNLSYRVGFGWTDLPRTLSGVRVRYGIMGDPDGNHWYWEGSDAEAGARTGAKPGTYYFWPTAEAASNATEVIWDYPEEVLTHRALIYQRIALTSDIPPPPGDYAAVSNAAMTAHADATNYTDAAVTPVAAEVASLESTVNAWQTYWDGDDVRVTITNYYGSTDLPRLYIEQRTNEVATATNHYRVVWDETTRLKPITNAVASNAAAIAALDAAKADRAWGNYDSHTGALAPADIASVSARGVVLGAGMAYRGYATNAGEVWMLTANEPQTVTVSTNGLFCIYDADGNPMIEIVKGDRRTVPATVAAVQKTADTFEVTFNVVASSHPLIEVCDDLVAADWRAEGEAGFPCAVTWRGGSGAWVCDLDVGDMPRLFVRGSYEVGGERYVKIMGERPAPATLTPRVDALEDALGDISTALDHILEGH